MRLPILFILFFTLSLHAAREERLDLKLKGPISKSTLKNLLLSDLQAMVHHFMKSVGSYNEAAGSIGTMALTSIRQSYKYSEIKKQCRIKIKTECLTELEEIRSTLLEIESSLLKNVTKSPLWLKQKAEIDITAETYFLTTTDEVSVLLFSATRKLNAMILTKRLDNQFEKNLMDISDLLSTSVTSLIPSKVAPQFDNIWESIMRPIYIQLVINQNPAFLESKLIEINSAWNGFHAEMSKPGVLQNSGAASSLAATHFSWTMILRKILR